MVVVEMIVPVTGSLSTTVTPASGVSPMLSLLVSSSTVPVTAPGLAMMPASQVRSDSPESSTVCTVLPVVVSASLSVVSPPTSFVVKA